MGRAVTLFAGFAVVLFLALYFTLGDTEGVDTTSVDEQTLTVHLTPACGCCSIWAEYMEDEGFQVEVHEHQNLASIRAEYGVPPFLAGCHTAVVDGYVVEGHVPAEDVRRLLDEKPDAIGIAVPGMPIGSPGMEIPGREPEAYQVLLLKDDGSQEVFAEH